jgi:hypothetical protein
MVDSSWLKAASSLTGSSDRFTPITHHSFYHSLILSFTHSIIHSFYH